MAFRRKVGVFLVALTMGCAVSPYRKADENVRQGQYEQAIQAYVEALQPHIREGKRYIFYDPEAVTGLGVVFMRMNRVQAARAVFEYVVRRTPTSGKAHFFLGACYEKLNRLDSALDVYRQYLQLPPSDPYRENMRWRMDWAIRRKIAEEIREAIRAEENLSVATIPENTVAVLYFYNLSNNPQWAPLAKGLAEMMITDLAQVDEIRVVERLRVQNLIEELNLTMTGLIDKEKTPQWGKILGARRVVKGTYLMVSETGIEMNAGTMDITDPRLPQLDQWKGGIADIFSLEKEIVLSVIERLGIVLTAEQRERIMKMPTTSFKAFVNYCYGLDALDLGNIDLAQEYFGRALEFDPGFEMAREWMVSPDIWAATHIEDIDQMGIRVSEAATSVQESERPSGLAVDAGSRMQSLGAYMDLGFLPGLDTREPFEEAYGNDAIETELPGPPDPPFFPDQWFLPGPPDPPNQP